MNTKVKNWKMLIGIIAAVVLAVGIVCGSIILADNTPERRLARELNLGDKYLNELDYERALASYQLALEIAPKNLDAYQGGLRAYEGLGDRGGMAEFYADALNVIESLDKKELESVYNTAVEIYLRANVVYAGNHEEIVRVLERGYDTLGEDERIIRELIKEYGILARNYIETGDYEKEQEIYKKILEKNPNNVDALYEWDQHVKDRFREHIEKNGMSGKASEPTPEPTAEPVRYVEEMFTVNKNEYESYGYAYGGSIPVKKGEKWGAVDYENKVIVPFEYDQLWHAPDAHGRFVLQNSFIEEYVSWGTTYTEPKTKQVLFDNRGSIIYQKTSKWDDVRASGGMYITYTRIPDDASARMLVEFHRMDGSVAASVECWDTDCRYGFYDGKCYIIDASRKDDIGTIDLQGNITWRINPFNTDEISKYDGTINWNYSGVPISTINHGYHVFASPVDPISGVRVYDEEGNRIAELAYMYLRADENGGITMGEGWVEQGYYGYWVDGGYYYNYGSKMVFQVGEKRVLIDFVRSSGGTERQPDLDNIVLAVCDHIEMSDEKYWLVQSGEKWGYIDHEGREMAMYEDAAAFSGGYALVKENGEAWLINESFQKLQNLGTADVVSTWGEIYRVASGDQYRFYCLTDR